MNVFALPDPPAPNGSSLPVGAIYEILLSPDIPDVLRRLAVLDLDCLCAAHGLEQDMKRRDSVLDALTNFIAARAAGRAPSLHGTVAAPPAEQPTSRATVVPPIPTRAEKAALRKRALPPSQSRRGKRTAKRR